MVKKEKEEFDYLRAKEISRALSSSHVQNPEFQRLSKNIGKYEPKWQDIKIGSRKGTICVLRGSNGGVVSTGVAWLAPKDKDNEYVGKRISFSRAVRGLVAKRLGISS